MISASLRRRPLENFIRKPIERLPRRKAVTLIAGLVCRDGIVLCSDREENVGSEGKMSVPKIFEQGSSQYYMAIATAGHSALADVAVKRIRQEAIKTRDSFVADHEAIIENVLRTLYRDYVWPSDVPSSREIALIIGLRDDRPESEEQFHLYCTCDEILQPKAEYVCAGVGELMGNYFLERLFERSLSVHEAMSLMAFVAKEAKDSVGAVGRETEIKCITKDAQTSSFYARSMDREIPHLWHCIEKFWKLKK
jgi:20S proteasome alpha/beta subunit